MMELKNFGMRCVRRSQFGWKCVGKINHLGECAFLPRWWNLRAKYRWSRETYPL